MTASSVLTCEGNDGGGGVVVLQLYTPFTIQGPLEVIWDTRVQHLRVEHPTQIKLYTPWKVGSGLPPRSPALELDGVNLECWAR